MNSNVGKKVKKRRLELGLSVDEVAAMLGKDRTTVYRYESNYIKNLPITVLEPLAEVLRTTPADLLSDDPSESNLRPDEVELLSLYNLLNENGQIEARSRLYDMTEVTRYRKKV